MLEVLLIKHDHLSTAYLAVKKATLQLRKFEQELLKGYKTYLTKLEKLASCLMRRKGDTRKFSMVRIIHYK